MDRNSYYHELFIRGQFLQVANIDRIPIKRSGPRRPASTMTEPNFYSMPPRIDANVSAINHTNDDYTSQVPDVPSSLRKKFNNPYTEMTRIHQAMNPNLSDDYVPWHQAPVFDQTLHDYNALLSRNRALHNVSDLLFQSITNQNIQRITSNLDHTLDNLSSYTTASLLGRQLGPIDIGQHPLLHTLTPRLSMAALTNGLDISTLLSRTQQVENTRLSTSFANLYDLSPLDPTFDQVRYRI
jgi:hypothetical protein